MVPYGKVPQEKVELPKRKTKNSFDDQVPLKGRHFAAEKYRRPVPSACPKLPHPDCNYYQSVEAWI
jgi:hypothetical protein